VIVPEYFASRLLLNALTLLSLGPGFEPLGPDPLCIIPTPTGVLGRARDLRDLFFFAMGVMIPLFAPHPR
jgi:hypothetical protein